MESAIPKRHTHYQMSAAKQQAMWEELTKLLKLDWVEQSLSNWSLPVLFACQQKKNGELRPVYNYWTLNSYTYTFNGPIPHINDIKQLLRSSKYFSVFDLSKAHQQLHLTKKSQPLVAFATPFGLYEPWVMMIGLANAGNHMQATATAVISGNGNALPEYESGHPQFKEGNENLKLFLHRNGIVPTQALEDLSPHCLVYIDNIIVHSESLEEHYLHVENLLKRLVLLATSDHGAAWHGQVDHMAAYLSSISHIGCFDCRYVACC